MSFSGKGQVWVPEVVVTGPACATNVVVQLLKVPVEGNLTVAVTLDYTTKAYYLVKVANQTALCCLCNDIC